MKYTRYLLIALAPLAACAYTPSQDLLTARTAYDAAAQGPAASLTPSELHEAKVALDRAERFDRDDQGSPEAKDQSYIAVRKAEWAQAKAATAQSEQTVKTAEKRFGVEQGNQLDSAKGQLTNAARIQEKQGEALVAQGRDLQTEKQRSAEATALATAAQNREKEAMDKLAALEKLTNDARGQVITLSSGVLFKTNQSVLLPGAYRRMDKVAEALKKVPERSFLIEGHTDSVGNEEKNLALSERRAQAVKDYLVSQGVQGDKIQTAGAGKSRPIADNGSTEGRAMNRRVEIVVLKSDSQTATK